MDVAVVSLVALLIAVVISSFTPVNVGTLCLGLALARQLSMSVVGAVTSWIVFSVL